MRAATVATHIGVRVEYEPPSSTADRESALTSRTRSVLLGARAAAAAIALTVPHLLAAQPLDTAAALHSLRDYAAACALDRARLWGRSLCGPMALVDRATRLIIANDTLTDRAYLPYTDAFIGVLPSSLPIANTSVEWRGRRWALVVLPPPPDRFDHTALLVHEAFHREQPALLLGGSDPANGHLDELEGRRWLRLELRAYTAALAGDAAAGRAITMDALLFRARRYALYPGADSLESALEMQEGLAEYSGVRLALDLTNEPMTRAVARIREFESTPSYVRSFAYATGAAIGLSLDRYAVEWRDSVRRVHDPAALLATALHFRSPPDLRRAAERRAKRYGDDGILREESTRDSVRRARLALYRARLAEHPTLLLRQHSLNRSFDPNSLVPFDSTATVYPTGTFSSAWGSLEVTSGGALVANDGSWLRVSAPPIPPDPGSRTIRGDGWALTLAPRWTIKVAASTPPGFEVVALPPAL